ncbi:TetR/AcrR family transcriptional regulator C-terminal domain-containing protein [Nocardiopsis changdeensis]|uniref:TetR/AcrR family transcriptional regulator C-terminal domain-containing protein n=1 Tax=Nocardiopsis TaxID=2013 RepID=UPI0021026E56|nr:MULTISPECIES: TetR/AcrR family transcriptional regulator C-terminal domain-containing protein [Nocardiopsis]
MSGSGPLARNGGRPATIDVDDIVAAGRELGMRDLSLSAVAARLGVTPAALYRHVDGRWGLEQLVGESLLADLELDDDPQEGVEAHLVGFSAQLRRFTLEHPGLADYLQSVFPRGASGAALMMSEVAALERRGYDTSAALVLTNAAAALTIGLAAAEDHRSAEDHPEGRRRREEAAERIVAEHPALGAAYTRMPYVTGEVFTHLLLTAAIGGLVAVAPVGRPVDEIIAELGRRGGLVPSPGRDTGPGAVAAEAR